jgi:cytochrome c oxidase cbb3-type subunit 1
MGLVGLGTAFYVAPKLANRPLHSHYLALLAFCTLMLFGSWTGIPNGAPVPVWMQAASATMSMLLLVPVAAAAVNYRQTVRDLSAADDPARVRIFFCSGMAAFVAAALARAITAPAEVSRFTDLTWFGPALSWLQAYGFFALMMFGAAYYIAPRVIGIEFPWPKLVRLHFFLAVAGIVFVVVPLAVGGILEGRKLQANVPFLDVFKGNLMFLRLSTVGELFLAIGHLLLLSNLTGLFVRFYQSCFAEAMAEVTAPIQPAGVKA